MTLRVLVEPGHGRPRDPGAPGPGGLWEADVVTEVCHFLGSKGGDGVQYLLKRRTAFPSLKDLFAWITRFRPEVVLSLHCDWAGAPGPSCVVWSLDPDGGRYARSALLADRILAALRQYVGGPTKVLLAPYLRDGKPFLPGVIRGRARLASVLVELGPMAERMGTPEWQSRAASAVDVGLREWASQTTT